MPRTQEPQALVEPREITVASRMCQDYLEHRRWVNDLTWQNPRHWVMGFYLGEGDTRLWVPKRRTDGKPDETDRVINFRHPQGRKAFGILMLAYGTAAITALFLVAIALGQRW